jgi:hypothetical protein
MRDEYTGSCAPPERGARVRSGPVGARHSVALPTGYPHSRLRRGGRAGQRARSVDCYSPIRTSFRSRNRDPFSAVSTYWKGDGSLVLTNELNGLLFAKSLRK